LLLLKELNNKIIESESNFIKLNETELNSLIILIEKLRKNKT